jgi:N-acetylglucosamine repressor
VQVLTKATHGQTRQYNERLVLRTVYDLGPISRADIARRTHLTRTTVSDVIGGLLEQGLVEESGRGPSSGGKAPILLRFVADSRHVIGLDLGEETFSGALANLRGQVSHQVELPVGGRDGADALALVYRLVDQLVEQAGVIRWAVNLDWQDLPLASLLTERYRLPAHVANDSQAAALGEYAFGDRVRTPNLVAIKVGRGVGAGIVLGGQLFQGDSHGAGEIGHIFTVDDGAACRCGRFGCLETVTSAPAIVREARALAVGTPGSLLHRASLRQGDLTLDDVRVALDADDPVACAIVLRSARFLGRAIAGLIGTLDVHRVVLHGSVTAFGATWLDAVREEATRRALPLLSSRTEIDIVTISSGVVLLGASAMLMTNELGLSLTR